MTKDWKPTFVYRRKRQHRDSDTKSFFANIEQNDRDCSSISSESPTPSSLQRMASLSQTSTEAVKSCTVHKVGHNAGDAGSFEGCLGADRTNSVEVLRSNGGGVLNLTCAKDNCSSSKSIMELSPASLKTDLDDAGASSVSDKMNTENIPDEMSETEKRISILRSLGLLDSVLNRNEAASEINGVVNEIYSLKSCKVCKRLESTANMLICDICEDAFHVSCPYPRIKSIPDGEWLCGSCSKKKRKLLRGKAGSSCTTLGAIHRMLTDTEPYISDVRVGDEFQANVPHWSGPKNDECELTGDMLEVNPANHTHKQEIISTKPLKHSVDGNWLQCQLITGPRNDDGDEPICGKWRRAPLFEVQTEVWECFDSVRWDPVHADCAVPQELETEEVIKQLKLLEALKPVQSSSSQPVAKKRKLDSPKSKGS